MSFAEAIKASRSDLVYLVRAKNKPTDKDAWWYVQIENKQILPVFLVKVKKTGVNLIEYGTILYSGWGLEPPEDIKLKIKDQFG